MVDPKDRFIAEAAEHGRCTESGDYKRGNAAFDRMLTALAELQGCADRGELVLTELLSHPNGWVRLGELHISCHCEQNLPPKFLRTSLRVHEARWNSTQDWFYANGERGD